MIHKIIEEKSKISSKKELRKDIKEYEILRDKLRKVNFKPRI